ncbi:esterase-like activity of phytase family protein [Marivita sp. S0852]|uniref:esterase-like activity of phytase family protein n=1 Tax=Marivita sp. S0852 TaxID=3373893 RepID=UPI003982699A
MTTGSTETLESDRVRFLSSFEWHKDRKPFGGYSAIKLAPNGKDFVVLSDRGHVIEGSIFRHEGKIIGLRSKDIAPLQFPHSLFGKTPKADTEGIARDTAGRLYISFEHENRIARLDTNGVWSLLPDHPEIRDLPRNRGLEALAIAPDGAVLAIPEVSDGLTTPFTVYRFRDGAGWDTALRLARHPGFLPVGADFDAYGRLYVLERGFAGFGFFSQVRRFDLRDAGLMQGEILLTTAPRTHDNLEGLSIWMTEDKALRMTLVSDDNFQRFQKTEIVEYAISN